MTYEIPCTACESEGYFFFQGRLESCHKCKGWGVMEETAEYNVWECGKFIDAFYTEKEAINALLECSSGVIKITYTHNTLNNQWNFGECLTC